VRKSSIVTLHYNFKELLNEFLDSVFEYTDVDRTPYEIIVVDSGSTDGSIEYLSELRYDMKKEGIDIHVVIVPKPYKSVIGNLPYNANIGVKIADGYYIVKTSNDMKIRTPNWLESMINCFESRKDVGIVIPAGVLGKEFIEPFSGYRLREEYCKDCFLLTTKDIWWEVGGMDERYIGYGKHDIDFSRMLKEKGYVFLVDGEVVVTEITRKNVFSTFSKERFRELIDLNNRLYREKWGD